MALPPFQVNRDRATRLNTGAGVRYGIAPSHNSNWQDFLARDNRRDGSTPHQVCQRIIKSHALVPAQIVVEETKTAGQT